MFFKLLIFWFMLSFNEVTCNKQPFEFYTENWFINSYDGDTEALWTCRVIDTALINSTAKNSRHNSEVKAFIYETHAQMFIQDSIFFTFPNLKHFSIRNVNINKIEPEFFKNATNLKTFQLYRNNITELQADLFKEAPNLESIHLKENRINIIDKFAFRGLPLLTDLFMQSNEFVISTFNDFDNIEVQQNKQTSRLFFITVAISFLAFVLLSVVLTVYVINRRARRINRRKSHLLKSSRDLTGTWANTV